MNLMISDILDHKYLLCTAGQAATQPICFSSIALVVPSSVIVGMELYELFVASYPQGNTSVVPGLVVWLN